MGFEERRDFFPDFSYSRFAIVRRGYDRDQVDETVESLQADLQIVTADRDAATAQCGALSRQLDRLHRELEDARAQIHRLNRAPASTAGMSDRLQKMLQIAQDEAAEVRARAETEASDLLATAEREAADVRAQYLKAIEELDKARQTVEDQRAAVLAEARAQAAELERTTRRRVSELDEQSRLRRRQIEEDFEVAMTSRRHEANAFVEKQERQSTAQALARIAAAEQRSRTMVEEAKARTEQLRTLRRQVAEQLLAARSALDTAARDLTPATEEEAILRGDIPAQAESRTDGHSARKEPSAAASRTA